jgi:hypothetical protein
MEYEGMRALQIVMKCLALSTLIATISTLVLARTARATAARTAQSSGDSKGAHDFDFELGTWKIHLKRRLQPLSGSNTWVEFDGTSVTRQVWQGRSQIEQFETDSPSGHIEGLTLRLYNPDTHQWSLYWANSKDGILVVPQIGQFKNGQGEFYAQDTLNGRSILVRFLWSNTRTNVPHFEQSFSEDGGKTWEVNWLTDQTRISEQEYETRAESTTPRLAPQAGAHDGQHDFDFEFGSWNAHLKRLEHPLSNSDTWVEYDGTSVVKKLWNGRANYGELEVANASSHIEGLTLRLYNPQSHQWRLYWANSKSGLLQLPTIGQFESGRGEFLDQEDFQGRSILVRFVFSDVTPTSFRTEQSFSADGGKTWEPNWTATFTGPK